MKPRKFLIFVILVALGVMLAGAGCNLFRKKKSSSKPTPRESSKTSSASKPRSIPSKILENKFGFLSGGPEAASRIKDFGALWARPHPGPFLWDSMQKSEDSEISFSQTDRTVEEYHEEGVAILVTLWPFAGWDQVERSDASDCVVSANDEFLPKGRTLPEKGGIGTGPETNYLPKYRCNPNDWGAYQKWVKAVVERYDGDGQEDMPDLKIPVKYWEVMNEPDLTGPEEEKGNERLDFYKQDAQAYKELLIKTSEAIRAADSEAKVLLAGAAGGNDQFLDFYRKVLEDKKAVEAFDIANVHCISNDDYGSFNVEPYKKMLESFGISKPIWVTEAEAMVSDDADVNATQVLKSTERALGLGAERIFFTRYDFKNEFPGQMKPPPPDGQPQNIKPEIDGEDSQEAYKTITSQ